MKIKINKEKCIGCGLCMAICPQVFALGDDGKAMIVEVADDKADCISTAKDGCPVGAISVEE